MQGYIPRLVFRVAGTIHNRHPVPLSSGTQIAFLGFSVQAWTTGEGALGSLAKFATSFAG